MMQLPYGPLAARRRTFDSLVRQAADRSLDVVCRLVAPSVESMSLCEARGYIRARAAREIRRQVRLLLAQHAGADSSWESPLAVRAAERVAPLALRKIIGVRSRHSHGVEAPAGQRRRAA